MVGLFAVWFNYVGLFGLRAWFYAVSWFALGSKCLVIAFFAWVVCCLVIVVFCILALLVCFSLTIWSVLTILVWG